MGIITAAIHREENQDEHFDPDLEGAEVPKRPFLLMHAAVIGFAMTLVVFVEMLCVAKVGIALPFIGKVVWLTSNSLSRNTDGTMA